MIKWFARLLGLVGLNAVPVVGVGWAGWTTATALLLYWCETMILVVLVAIRIHLHRRWTNKRGHYTEVRTTITKNGLTTNKTRIGHFGTGFLAVALIFGLVQAIFLAFILWKTHLLETVDLTQLKQGLTAITFFLLFGFFMDLAQLRQWPFARIRSLSNAVLWRVFLVQIVIIVGVIGAAWFGLPKITLIAFVALKFYTDATAHLGQYDPAEAPGWMVRLLGSGFSEYWRVQKRDDQERALAEEEVFDGRPMPFEENAIGQQDRQSRMNS